MTMLIENVNRAREDDSRELMCRSRTSSYLLFWHWSPAFDIRCCSMKAISQALVVGMMDTTVARTGLGQL